MTNRVQAVVVCEDRQHEVFIRYFLLAAGWERHKLKFLTAPSGRGAAEQWVRAQYPIEAKALRQKPHVARALVVMVDADTMTVTERIHQLEEFLEPPRGPTEPIALFIPKRNIETWISYLRGEPVDESTPYKKLANQSARKPQVHELKRLCDSGKLPDAAPGSLKSACAEWAARVPKA